MNEIVQIAEQSARRAGQYIASEFDQRETLVVEEKTLHDYVSRVDRTSEQMITEDLLSLFPEHQIIGEEFGRTGSEQADYQWIIDPLDGTTNFVRGIAHFAISIGVIYRGKPYVGVVYDPIKNELFSALRGHGAQLNGKSIRVANRGGLRGALVATGIPYSGEPLSYLAQYSSTMNSVLNQHTSGIRRLGAAALDLAYVAAGRYDGFWESHLKQWDIAAGVLLVEEAGGVVTDLRGQHCDLSAGFVLAASAGVHSKMLEITRACYAKSNEL